jgi:hypothetical protein
MSTSLKNFIENPSRGLANFNYRLRELWRRQTAQIHPDPIFIFGNQKSGTSAIAALLGEATGLAYTIDIFCLYQGLEEKLLKGNSNFDEVIRLGRYYFSKPIIKDPGFTFFYDDIASRFPISKKAFVLRDPRHNIRSILNRLEIQGNLIDLSTENWCEIQKKFPGWFHIIEGSLAQHKGKDYIETLALRSKKALRIYIENQSHLIGIKYEDFQKNKTGEIENLAHKLGLKLINDITPIKDLQFQPKGQSSQPLVNFFGSQNLSKIERICAEEMSILGYL